MRTTPTHELDNCAASCKSLWSQGRITENGVDSDAPGNNQADRALKPGRGVSCNMSPVDLEMPDNGDSFACSLEMLREAFKGLPLVDRGSASH